MVRRLAAEYASAAEPEASSSLPPVHARLLTQLQALPPANTGAAAAVVDTQLTPFANVEINHDACTGCGLCSRFCPTDALAFSTGDGAFQLDFTPSACIDCGICALACPSHALHYAGAAPAAALVDGSRHLLARGTVSPAPNHSQTRPGQARERSPLFEQLAGAQRRPALSHQNGGVARPSCQSEGVSA